MVKAAPLDCKKVFNSCVENFVEKADQKLVRPEKH